MVIEEFKYFFPERPRLMSIKQPLFETLDADPDWFAELKYNGCRLELHYNPGEGWQFWNRHGEKMSYTPNAGLQESLKAMEKRLKGYCIFDGELRHNKVPGIYHKIILYDVFAWDGSLLLNLSYRERRDVLAQLVPLSHESLTVTSRFRHGFQALFDEQTKYHEIEGLVIKNQNGILDLGRKNLVPSVWMWKVRRPSNSYRF